ncbi:MAG TPA: Holliday junction resolvase RuvX [Thermoanaerobaculia bacterium]|nr:Holliday junction resolvase RuvX [Thermoanaerobaculia bacterium]
MGRGSEPPQASPPLSAAAAGPILAVDFGHRRIGLAITDAERRLALPLTTLARASDRQAVRRIAALAAERGVSELVVGDPRTLDGGVGEASLRARGFADKLAAATGLRCTLVTETLTSAAAEERLREAGAEPRRHRERIDQLAAQLLLEELLARRARGER